MESLYSMQKKKVRNFFMVKSSKCSGDFFFFSGNDGGSGDTGGPGP